MRNELVENKENVDEANKTIYNNKEMFFNFVRQRTFSKTKRCIFCEGRYEIDKMLFLHKDIKSKKENWICKQCNEQFDFKPI